MDENEKNPSILQPQELEAVYAISREVAEAEDTETPLDRIVRIVRPVFIFDNMVLYICSQDNDTLEPRFARAIGRGRFREADLAWGETTAQQTYLEQHVMTQVEQLVGADTDQVPVERRLGDLEPSREGGRRHLLATRVLEHRREGLQDLHPAFARFGRHRWSRGWPR